ncbi:tubulin binding cofactor A [Piptocephalis cylindrospora]|uniref:Tubulin-specific chaperone A n=1 Tax=Piptocephalis cylindrospora TaxID=1907219 RepID=A0A4P9Y8N0_9FUNG|nr:tubulin binding cofactor A [Piptocephalis cylindrospora]|eukprot:RKP14340.1 tubulin binding cofactor A [Piptocephalis cylindrospora]
MSLREIKIKAGATKRLHKEHASYFKEAEHQKARIQRMKDENKDEYDIKKQYDVLDDTLKIIPDVWKRYEQSRGQLEALLNADPANADSPEGREAKELLDLLDATPLPKLEK